MVMFLLSFVKGVQIRGGESISASGYGPGGSISASGFGPGGSISASGFGPGGPILGGSKSTGTPAYANLLMGEFETNAINGYAEKPFLWFRCIDDILMVWTHGE